MYFAHVGTKEGFFGVNPIVYDDRGIFYAKKGNVHFNLPKGDYKSQGPIFKLKYPVKYRVPALPAKQLGNGFPKIDDLSVIVAKSVSLSKALIDPSTNRIILSKNDLDKLSTPEIVSILFHELGHYFYKSESLCDRFSLRCMIEIGYNPSQFKSFFDILGNSEESIERKLHVYDYSSQIKQVR